MKKNNSKKWIKTITITTAVLVFAAGAAFALKSAGTANTDKDGADTVVAAANEATDLVVKETVSEKETEVITETAAKEKLLQMYLLYRLYQMQEWNRL